MIIDLSPHEDDCRVCGRDVVTPSHLPSYGIPVYEDLIVPDDWRGEWGGFTVCKPCYALVLLLQSERPGQCLRLSEVRAAGAAA